MHKERSNSAKLKLVIIGFLIFFIPIFFLCYELKTLYKSTKEDLKLELKDKILSVSTKFKNDLDTYNYLNSEITKIHTLLFPDLKEEITDKILEDSFAQNLYTKETFDKLLSLTEKKFAPIFVVLGTNNLINFFAYYSPELKSQFENQQEKKEFLRSKTIYDTRFLIEHYKDYFNYYNYYIIPLDANENVLYKYLTRFKFYQYYTKTYYTDYFGKQLLYNISKYTFSKKGIHGYYSLIIPQSQINPEYIINEAIKKNNGKEVKIQLITKKIKDLNDNQIRETENGYEYIIDLTTDLKKHINTYKRSHNQDKSHYLLDKSFKLSINYPQKLEEIRTINFYVRLTTIFFVLLYILFSFRICGNKYKLYINLTPKLIIVLSVITILPIIGVGILTWVSTQKISKIIDYNAFQNLSNEINNISIKNEENNKRQLSEIFEIKRKIEKNSFSYKMSRIDEGILSPRDVDTWYRKWTSFFIVLSQDGKHYNFSRWGDRVNIDKIEKSFGVFLPKYANNLNILNKGQTNFKDAISSTFTLGALENYITQSMEENSAGQESIPHKHLLSFNETFSAVYFYVQDFKKQHNLMINVHTGNDLIYKYISNLRIPNHQNWFESKNEYSDINLGIAISDHFYMERNTTYPFLVDSYQKVNDIITRSILSKDSISEKSQNPDGNLEKKCIYKDNDAFVIGGVAKSNYNNLLSFLIYMIFPILLSYALFIMLLLTRFISVFIKEPVNIYREAIDSLNNQEYGTTIHSFSKDEFESITTAFNEMSLAIKQKLMISRYVSDKLIQSVSQDNLQGIEDGKQEKVTLLFSDIRNFTGISEMQEPSVIVEMLNSYFTEMQLAISKNGGIIDKYIGDAIQAVFYDEPDKENQVIRAAKAAIDMRKALVDYNKGREESGLFTIQNGIGIDTDVAITGTIGTEKGRKDFSVNGDVVSRAANLEAKTKQTQSKILLSKSSIDELDCHVTNAPRNDEYNSKIVSGNKTNHTLHQSGLIFKDFDEDSVELIDVR